VISPAAAADLIIESATGVDVHIRLAGPGARSLAYLTDWVIRVILALAWYAAAALIYNGAPNLAAHSADARWLATVIAPAAALYVLYHWVLEPAMRGSTPGKRMCGIRIASRDGSVPSPGPLLVRNVFRLIDSLPLAYGVGLLAVMLTPEHVRIGDLAAGTLLIYEKPAPLPPRAAVGLTDRARAEAIGELLERWSELGPHSRRRLARALLCERSEALAPRERVAPAAGRDEDGALRSELERLLAGCSR